MVESPGHIGTDEAGKGDYFGDLVVAAVFLPEEYEPRLRALGVRDSKRLSEGSLFRLEEAVRQLCPHELVRISPGKYNELHARMRNLNHLLAWAHARALENLLARVEAKLVISDQFGDESLLRSALMARGREVELRQRTGAEEDAAVAAASILARAGFLRSLARLSEETGLRLPRGATHVAETARELLRKGGPELLARVAKVHFKTTKQVMSR
jgi:ribonuclease HIII